MKVYIVPIPLVFYAGEIFWPFTTQNDSKRFCKKIRNRSNAGFHINLALNSISSCKDEVIIVVDDRFTIGSQPTGEQLKLFKGLPVPQEIVQHRILYESDFEPRFFCNLKGCSGIWGSLVEMLIEEGFDQIEAWIPQSCMANVAHATGLMQFPEIILHLTKHNENKIIRTYTYKYGTYVHPESS